MIFLDLSLGENFSLLALDLPEASQVFRSDSVFQNGGETIFLRLWVDLNLMRAHNAIQSIWKLFYCFPYLVRSLSPLSNRNL